MYVNNAAYHHPTPWDTQFEPLTLPEMLERTVRRDPAAPFLHFLGRTFSYGEIFAEAQRFAAGLIASGIKKGDRVGLFLPNVPIYASAYYGAMMAGAIVVNFSPLYSVEELAWQVGDSGTRVLVTVDVPELYGNAAEVLESSDLETLIVGSLSEMLPWIKGTALKILKRSQIAKVEWSQSTRRWSDMLGDAGGALPELDPKKIWRCCNIQVAQPGDPKARCWVTINCRKTHSRLPRSIRLMTPPKKSSWGRCPFSMCLRTLRC